MATDAPKSHTIVHVDCIDVWTLFPVNLDWYEGGIEQVCDFRRRETLSFHYMTPFSRVSNSGAAKTTWASTAIGLAYNDRLHSRY